MTVSEALKNWMRGCDCVEIVDVDTDRLEANAESLGLYKQAQRETTAFLDGSAEITEYYYFLARWPTTLESERVNSQTIMSNLESWIEDKNMDDELPEVPGVERVFVANGFYMLEAESDEAVYQVSIGITYLKERK